jgi:hypothetical protein
MLCIEVSKEKVTPKQFWKLYRELFIANDDKHLKELHEAKDKTSLDYRLQLASQGTQE